jgi:hypothetical protein
LSRIVSLRSHPLPSLAAALLALLACSKSEPPPPLVETAPPPPATAAPSEVSNTPAPSASAARDAAGLATEEDFEDESASKITPETLDAQLDALEREIQAE